ncbi:MAG TPA: hypothetical protein VFV34_11940, partial [Blastocatellia bacterium]|nr:hypothetical protein [Blastocatellia bacterium]
MPSKPKYLGQKKAIFLIVLLAGLGAVLVYQFMRDPPKRNPQTTDSSGQRADTSVPVLTERQAGKVAGKRQQQDIELARLLDDNTPLEIRLLGPASGNADVKRNIFAYYVKPPAPPPPPPPPPPIGLKLVQPQTAVAGTPRPFSLTVAGESFPPDAQIIFGGTPKPTKRLSTGQLQTEITPAEYSYARNVNVEVKSQSKSAELYSNAVIFVAQQSPEPPFKFIGIIGDLGVFEVNTTSGAKEYMRVRRGGMIEGVWRIDAITPTGV